MQQGAGGGVRGPALFVRLSPPLAPACIAQPLGRLAAGCAPFPAHSCSLLPLLLPPGFCLQASAGGVAVRGLFAASPAQLARLKEGEQEKQKSYVAVCWLPRPLTDADVATIEGTNGLEVHQQTPVRVGRREGAAAVGLLRGEATAAFAIVRCRRCLAVALRSAGAARCCLAHTRGGGVAEAPVHRAPRLKKAPTPTPTPRC